MQVRLLRNRVTYGGAVDTTGTNTLTLTGHSSVVQNNTADFGGAFYIEPLTTLLIKGRLCASGNRVLGVNFNNPEGRFAFADGQVVFAASSEVLMSDNAPDTVYMSGPAAVQCGVGAPSWPSGRAYSITGRACACNTTFVAGNSTTCESAFPDCGPSTWDQGTCACVSAVWLGYAVCQSISLFASEVVACTAKSCRANVVLGWCMGFPCCLLVVVGKPSSEDCSRRLQTAWQTCCRGMCSAHLNSTCYV